MRRVASVSFGKDSLAMLLLLLEKNIPLDEVIFYNSEMEFQAIYDIRDRIKPVLEQRGIRFTEVKPGVPFLYNMLERPVDSKKNGFHLGYGWCGGPCRWGTKLKTRTLDGVALDADVHYVGIAADEPERLERLEAPKCSPLAEAGMTEADCLAFCYERGFFWEENGVRLYDILDRVSCWCCKNKNRKELKNILWLSHLISQTRKRYRQNQTLQQGRAKVAAAEAEGKLVQIGLEVFLGQAMIGAQDKRFGVADHDVQPMEQAGIGVVGFVFMRVAFQSRKVTAITIAVDHAAIGEGGMGKFLHRCLLDVGRYPHFQKAGIALLIQSQRHENLLFFCASAPLFTYCWAAKVRIIKFDDTAQLMGFIPLAHSGANAPEHGPCGFVGSPKHRRQLHSGNTPLILAHEIERQKPLRQWHMGFVQHRPCCYRGLIAALGALISPVGQPVSMVAATFGANIPVLPAQRCQILLALCLAGKSLQKRPKWQALLLRHDSFPPLFGIMALFYHALCPIIWDFPRLS